MRPVRAPAFLTLHFAPGECAQVDWGHYGSVPVGNTRRRLSFFVMVLCYSRLMYVEFTVSQTMEHFLGCHVNAFEAFAGRVPAKIMVDNLKSAVLQRSIGQAPVFNPRYADFARHHRFEIAPCNVRAGHEKGRVEAGVGYVKKNFLAGLDIPDFRVRSPPPPRTLTNRNRARQHKMGPDHAVEHLHSVPCPGPDAPSNATRTYAHDPPDEELRKDRRAVPLRHSSPDVQPLCRWAASRPIAIPRPARESLSRT